ASAGAVPPRPAPPVPAPPRPPAAAPLVPVPAAPPARAPPAPALLPPEPASSEPPEPASGVGKLACSSSLLQATNANTEIHAPKIIPAFIRLPPSTSLFATH